ncbi:MAG: SRPBCC family protein [Gammaproteobacteria bacterium]|jgi:hypothetical protein
MSRWLLCCLLLLPFGLCAGELRHLQVTSEKGEYRIEARVRVDAPVDAVRATLTDYRHLSDINPDIRESRVLPSPAPGVTRVQTLVHACAFFYCVDMKRIEDVQQLPGGSLVSTMVPDHTSFKSGQTFWGLRPLGTQTDVTYRASMRPAFWIPPLIGPAVVRSNLRREMRESFERLESIARARAEGAQGGGDE